MSTKINILNSDPIDLSISPLFNQYYNNASSYTAHIIEKEINNNHYLDEDFLKIFKSQNAIVIDAGANIGLFSIYLNKSCTQIFAVEPTKEHADCLKEICYKLNINNIECKQIAFNNFNGFCTFMVDSSNTTTNRIANTGTLVKCQTILSFIKEHKLTYIDLLKLDIEGGEKFSVLEDPTFLECSKFCKNIYIEIHPPYASAEQIINLFNSMGYKTKYLNSEHLNNNLNILGYK
jgi:FkbM family methyltransferase